MAGLGLLLLLAAIPIAWKAGLRQRTHAWRADVLSRGAESAAAAGRLKDARVLALDALRLHPSKARVALVRTVNERLQWEALEASLTRWRTGAPDTLTPQDVILSAQSAETNAAIQLTAGSLLLAMGQPGQAVPLLRRARELTAAQPQVLLALGSALARLSNATGRAEGRDLLVTLRQFPATQRDATWALASLLTQDAPHEALTFWEELLEGSPDDWAFLLGRIDALHAAGHNDWQTALPLLEPRAGTPIQRREIGARLAQWQGRRALTPWLQRLPEGEADLFETRCIILAAHEHDHDSGGLLSQIDVWERSATVQPAQSASFRLAAMRVLQANNDLASARVQLQIAVSRAPAQQPLLNLDLARACESLALEDAAVDCYVEALAAPGDVRQAALTSLHRIARGRHEAGDILRILTRIAGALPEDTTALNNLAIALLQQDETIRRGLDVARRAHERNPGDAPIRETYAWALVLSGQLDLGTSLYDSLSPEVLNLPEVRVHHAELLRLSGAPDKAAALCRSVPTENLLPRERALLKQWQAAP